MPDRSWTIAPVIAWFVGALVVALCVLDGGVQAIADRLTAQRAHDTAQPANPMATPGPIVADVDDTDVSPAPPPVASGPGYPEQVGALDDPRHAMEGFYKAVAAEQKGTLGRAVRVSWYGDSVIADDQLAGRLRKRLQDDLGDGGPGFVYVVRPHRFCNNEAIIRGDEAGWRPYAISTNRTSDGLYGPAGSTAETDGGRATIKLASGKVTGVELYYLAQPHGGEVTITGDGAELVRAATAGDQKAAGWATGRAADGVKKLVIDTRGNVRLFGLDLENDRGAVVDNLGIVSVNVKSFGANDPEHWAAEVDHRGADLVMIMIGANEAEWLSPGDRDTKDYQSHYEAVLAPIRKAIADRSCLVVSPTDQAEEHDGDYRSRPVMPLLVDAQRKAAHAQGCAFYSTYDWMGGKGSAAKWFRKGLVSSDFQHLTQRGANRMADAVHDALMAGYRRYAHE
ncbi:MAG: GDSL-type esterase/lipase family protein [Acidobacteriota bacterium]